MPYIIISDSTPPYAVGPFASPGAAHDYIKTDPAPARFWITLELNMPAIEPTDAKPVRKVCAHCGSTDVHLDAWSDWNENAQQWELSATFDNQHCDSCGSETTIADEVIES